jgi:RNA-directed DNA polymerase
MSTAQQPMYKWQDLPWKEIQRSVFKLQKRIYQAAQRGDRKTVHRLQRLLINSWSARCLAVRRVTQDNRGKKTAGVDGVKRLTPSERLELAKTLKLTQTAQPVRRVWIPKPGKSEQRPLGIPTIRDRAEQALAKLALEPEWEAYFEPNSYGFRPGRSAHDAIQAIYVSINRKPKYVLDADIAQCFDRIDHQALLGKLNTFPFMRRAIRAWLGAGVMEEGELFPTTQGSPQGGVVSPLLANVALHGLEEVAATIHPDARVIRYADDLVVLHDDLEVIKKVSEAVSRWLLLMGLELKPSKTHITHTLHEYNGYVGFNFLGFNVRQYKAGKNRSARSSRLKPLGFKTLIKPSKEAISRHYQEIERIVEEHNYLSQTQLIRKLNPIVRGWTRYYSSVVSKDAFSRLAHLMFIKLWRWAKRRHPRKPHKWIARKYWLLDQGGWKFAAPDASVLYEHLRTPIKRHVKVRGSKSPYDGDWVYWVKRKERHPELPTRVAKLVKRQSGRCSWCGLYFTSEDWLEVDHVIPTTMGGRDRYDNWQLLHKHCHHQKTAQDRQSEQLAVPMTKADCVRSRML